MASIFSRINAGEIPGHFVARSPEFFAILDINPLKRGHTLVIPTQETDYLFDLDAELLGRYMKFSQKVARAIEAVVPCARIGVAVVGLEVPHAHIHLIPINSIEDMNFGRPKLALDQDEMAALAQSIASKFNELDLDSSR